MGRWTWKEDYGKRKEGCGKEDHGKRKGMWERESWEEGHGKIDHGRESLEMDHGEKDRESEEHGERQEYVENIERGTCRRKSTRKKEEQE